MQCPKCQFENPEGSKFCGGCGQKFACTRPKCETSNLARNKFCNACGYNLRKPVDVSAVDCSKPKSFTPKFLADKILTSRSSIEGERKLVNLFNSHPDKSGWLMNGVIPGDEPGDPLDILSDLSNDEAVQLIRKIGIDRVMLAATIRGFIHPEA